ncbi:MAG: prepilin-type N-terminal cleavage/methylation domain-containing protein [Luteimonas sp.]
MLSRTHSISARARGFSLIELMVALAVGLIVIGGVLGLVLSILRSNNQTIQSTRLTQELRATAAVIAAEIRRSRSVGDPLAAATLSKGAPPVYLYQKIDSSTPGCIRYAYAGATNGAYRVIRRDAATNKVVLAAEASDGAATCALAGVSLNSAQVNITGLTFTPNTTGATPALTAGNERSLRRFDIVVTGQFVSGDPEINTITRSITQTVFVRSVGDG